MGGKGTNPTIHDRVAGPLSVTFNVELTPGVEDGPVVEIVITPQDAMAVLIEATWPNTHADAVRLPNEWPVNTSANRRSTKRVVADTTLEEGVKLVQRDFGDLELPAPGYWFTFVTGELQSVPTSKHAPAEADDLHERLCIDVDTDGKTVVLQIARYGAAESFPAPADEAPFNDTNHFMTVLGTSELCRSPLFLPDPQNGNTGEIRVVLTAIAAQDVIDSMVHMVNMYAFAMVYHR